MSRIQVPMEADKNDDVISKIAHSILSKEKFQSISSCLENCTNCFAKLAVEN